MVVVITWYVSGQKLFNVVVRSFVSLVVFFNQSNLYSINAQFIDLLTRYSTHLFFKMLIFLTKLWRKN